MGTFNANVAVANPVDPTRSRTVELLVDTGATLSFLPASVLQALGITPLQRMGEFETASGAVLRRRIGIAVFSIDGVSAGAPVVFAEPGDSPVLGAVTLESLGLTVDPIARRLAPRRYLAL